jgi:hypothetical protein
MKKAIPIIVTVVMFIASIHFVCGQGTEDSTVYQVETHDDNIFVGTIVSRDSLSIRLLTENFGEITIAYGAIKKITSVSKGIIKGGKIWADNPQATRYFWSPNGYGIKAGEAYYQNIWVFYNQFVVGITDNISLGAGIVPLFLFAGTSTPVWITPKFSIPVVKEKFNVGGGALLGMVLGEENAGFGILYGTSTFGSKDNNLSIGMGYGYAGGDWAKSPMINVSAMLRASSRAYFITENYYLQTEDDKLVLISVGGRSVTRGGIGIDYGLFLPFADDMDGFIAFPWLGVTVPIGKAGKKT